MGHTFGAAGAIESIMCILALRDGVLPPTINYRDPDPECDLDYVPNAARHRRVRVAMNNAYGFGGYNSSIVFRKWER
jgi:3-oxoacyl-[acyl-carrier-protein] synthase II